MTRHSRHPRAFTMIEVLASMLIISVMLGAVMKLVSTSRAGLADSVDRARAQALASVLMAEICDQNFADPTAGASAPLGPDSGETDRSLFNDVDDYAEYRQSNPKDRAGNALADASWKWYVTVSWVSPTVPTTPSGSATTAKLITVNVYKNNRLLESQTAVRTQAVTR